MKLSLVVVTEGKAKGQTIPISLSQFIIGRDPQCQMRPASALISKRHCALINRSGKFFIRDFDSTNGTFLNEEPVKGERELNHEDQLKVGPLSFRVVIEGAVPVNKPTPLPKQAAKDASVDDSVADMLLGLADDTSPESAAAAGQVPDGTTVMDMVSPYADKLAEAGKEGAKPETKPAEKKKESANTSAAAKAILDKYTRRPRA